MAATKKTLGTPIPLRLHKRQLIKTAQAIRKSGLSQAEVLRRAIDAGLPSVVQRFSTPMEAKAA